ncbi:hypothetical protein T492DRAFT_413518 [Pavlovales sp. CCMP2436]|nr:hypothetical protein T492DRAFT_413518 [Pavlovales sp. CCMP2436]
MLTSLRSPRSPRSPRGKSPRARSPIVRHQGQGQGPSPRRPRAKRPAGSGGIGEAAEPNDAPSAYCGACAQLDIAPEPGLLKILATGSSSYSTRAGDAVANFASSPEHALFAMCDGIRASVSLTTIELHGLHAPGSATLWSRNTLSELSHALNQTPNVTSLSLAASRLDDSLAKPLAALASHCRHLRELNLSDNEGLDAAFAQALVYGLGQAASKLEKIDISNLPGLVPRAAWGPELGRFIASQQGGSSLSSIRASVHPSSVMDVLQGVSRNLGLTSLGLTHARFHEGVVQQLVHMVGSGKPCAHLRELDLTYSYIGDTGGNHNEIIPIIIY